MEKEKGAPLTGRDDPQQNIRPAGFAEEERRHFDRVLALALGIGAGLLSCGASVSRVEMAVKLICLSCGAKEVNVMALPSVINCSIRLADGSEVSQMKRNCEVTNNFRRMEMYNQLSRDVCAKKLTAEEAELELEHIAVDRGYSLPVSVLSGGLVAGIFTVYFGGALIDSIPSFIVGCLMMYVNILLSRRDFNSYARTFVLSLLGGALSILLSRLFIVFGAHCSVSMVSIGTIMVVVPGLLICNAVRDMFSGDIYSGSFELLNGLLTILAIAAGYSSSIIILRSVMIDLTPVARAGIEDYAYRIITCLLGACSVGIMFNCQLKKIAFGVGNILATFALYLVIEYYFADDYFLQFLIPTLLAGLIAEIQARAFKAPSTIFLVPAIIVLVPGGSLYYTVNYIVNSDMALAQVWGERALLSLLGIAVGISVITAIFQIIHPVKGGAALKRLHRIKNKQQQRNNQQQGK